MRKQLVSVAAVVSLKPDKGTPGETQGRNATGPRIPQDRRAAEGPTARRRMMRVAKSLVALSLLMLLAYLED